jgi:hypothetical protein
MELNYDVRSQLVRHLHANLVGLPHVRRTVECRFGKAASADLAPDNAAHGRLCERRGDLCFCVLVDPFWKALGI